MRHLHFVSLGSEIKSHAKQIFNSNRTKTELYALLCISLRRGGDGTSKTLSYFFTCALGGGVDGT